MSDRHEPIIKFWGGPQDGDEFLSPGLRALGTLPEHMREWRGYRLQKVCLHSSDNTIHSVHYVWREVWES